MHPISPQLEGALARARALGFLGPGPIVNHLQSAERFADVLRLHRATGPGLDLGSGGGVPGLLLAEWFPDVAWVLLDASRRRTSFLANAIATCGLAPRVEVVRGRAEELSHDATHREAYGVVTARSFGPPAATAEAAAGFVRVGGVVLVSDTFAERVWPDGALARVSLRSAKGQPGVRALRKAAEVAPVFPRPLARQRSDPLF